MTVAEKNFKAIFNLKDSTFQFLVRKILAPPPPAPFIFDKLSPDIILILSYKKVFIDIHKLAHFPIPEIQKFFVNNIDFSPSKYKSGKQNFEILLSTNLDATFTK